jgi:hypothetical protein
VTRAKNPRHHPFREVPLFRTRLFGANGSFTILAMAFLPERELKRTYSKGDAIFDSQYFSKFARRSDDMLTTYVYNRSRIDNFDYHDFTQSGIKSECPTQDSEFLEVRYHQEIRARGTRSCWRMEISRIVV